MAYQTSSNPLDPQGRSILTQVAFKKAVDAASAGGSYNEATFFEAFPVFVEALTSSVSSQKEEFWQDVEARKANGETVADAPPAQADSAPSSAAVDGVTIVQDGDGTPDVAVPGWAITQAKAKGLSSIEDKRGWAKNTKRPHFTSTDGEKTPFWPPKS